jgi:eukaryotic-like serine/threonine-protein kinase
MSLGPGSQVGDYQILRELGAGGMGKVYQVRNVISDRVEAMKVLLPDLVGDPGLADRFLREIKVQAALDHPNIAGLRTAMREGNQLLMVMEFVEGHTVSEYLAQGPLPVANAVGICMDVLLALEYAHARGIVHRDIKPSNVMITKQGQVKLMDFGIARVMNDPSLTQTHQTTGSLYYMSPEQINGAQLDGRSDLYSLAISLYEMLTARRPFDGENTFAIMAAHMQQAPVPPVQLDGRVPAAVSDAILRGMAKDANARFQSAGEFRQALGQALQAQAQPQPQQAAPVQAQPAYAAAAEAAPPSKSPRTLYMLAGSLATVGVLALAITQGPKFLKTSAQEQDPTPVTTTVQDPVTTTDPGPVFVPDPAPGAQDAAPAGSAGGTTPVPVTRQAAQPEARQMSQPETRQVSQPATRAAQAGSAAPTYTPPQVAERPAAAPPQPATLVQQQAPAPQAPAVDTGALQEQKRRIIQMAQRIATAKAALQSLRQSMAQQGLSPRAELQGASQRMDFEMDQAEAALNGSNAGSARQHLDYAERALEQLEKALNL